MQFHSHSKVIVSVVSISLVITCFMMESTKINTKSNIMYEHVYVGEPNFRPLYNPSDVTWEHGNYRTIQNAMYFSLLILMEEKTNYNYI